MNFPKGHKLLIYTLILFDFLLYYANNAEYLISCFITLKATEIITKN
jgi:hypothetical protein